MLTFFPTYRPSAGAKPALSRRRLSAERLEERTTMSGTDAGLALVMPLPPLPADVPAAILGSDHAEPATLLVRETVDFGPHVLPAEEIPVELIDLRLMSNSPIGPSPGPTTQPADPFDLIFAPQNTGAGYVVATGPQANGTPQFTGGVQVAAGDVNGDGIDFIVPSPPANPDLPSVPDGPIIAQDLFQRLDPLPPQFGMPINFAGDRLEIYFDAGQVGVESGDGEPEVNSTMQDDPPNDAAQARINLLQAQIRNLNRQLARLNFWNDPLNTRRDLLQAFIDLRFAEINRILRGP